MIKETKSQGNFARSVSFSIGDAEDVVTVRQQVSFGGDCLWKPKITWCSFMPDSAETVKLFIECLNKALEYAEAWDADTGKSKEILGESAGMI